MYVRARMTQGCKSLWILEPHAAIGRDPRGNATVMVVNAENKVEPRIVKTAQSINDKWVVTEGLAAGERVIVEGLQKRDPMQWLISSRSQACRGTRKRGCCRG